MAVRSSSGTAASVSRRAQVQTWIIEALAEVRVIPVEDLTREIDADGQDFEIDSKEAEVVLCILEYRLGQELAHPEDLRSEQLTSLGTLTDLVVGRYVPA